MAAPVPISFVDRVIFHPDMKYRPVQYRDQPIDKPTNEAYVDTLAPGASRWHIQDGNRTLQFICPCGCGAVNGIPVQPDNDHHSWNWNGDELKPTLTPSILRTSGCKWHGFLTNGEFVTC